MYTGSATAAGTAGVLAYTGAGSVLWLILAGFTLIGVGFAALRLTPKRRRKANKAS